MVKEAKFVANIVGKNCYKALKFDFLPLGNGESDKEKDKKYIDMFQNFFQRNCFYFSNEYDLTSSFEKCAKNDFSDISRYYDSRFFYNEIHMQEFILNDKLATWVQPFICGLLEWKNSSLNGKTLSFILISRRDKNRAGMRFMSRGSDLEGNCTNFAETEQILVIHEEIGLRIYSYLQTRGSIPVIWKQTPSLKWAPKLQIEANNQKVKKAFICHMNKIKEIYGKNLLINLIDKKGSQYSIGKIFTELFNGTQNDGDMSYVWFDFHHECRKMQWHNLSKLMDLINKELKEYKFTRCLVKNLDDDEKNKIYEINQEQEGVIRTNCMDCLDRTNVVQSVIARGVLLNQLYNVNYFINYFEIFLIFFQANLYQKPNGNPFEELPGDLEETFRDFWTKNADRMSILYSGTGALKTDFTRTGKRSFPGKLEDGRRALLRYVLNNFCDTYNQNSLDFLLGKVSWGKIKNDQSIIGKNVAFNAVMVIFIFSNFFSFENFFQKKLIFF